MKIIRFIDEQGQICFGRSLADGRVTLLEGQLLDELKETDKEVSVKKLLTPLEPAAILCIGLNYHQHAVETGFDILECCSAPLFADDFESGDVSRWSSAVP